jgi:hypothetical protein
MFDLFSRARNQTTFKARSVGRDAETDRSRISPIANSIDDALQAAEAERAGLGRRMEDVLLRAALVTGNGGDEYLSRETVDNNNLNRLDADIANGERRLKELAANIEHLKFLKTTLVTRFPDLKPPADHG